jgi:hypothetical protein
MGRRNGLKLCSGELLNLTLAGRLVMGRQAGAPAFLLLVYFLQLREVLIRWLDCAEASIASDPFLFLDRQDQHVPRPDLAGPAQQDVWTFISKVLWHCFIVLREGSGAAV